ncbi:MAG: hypothetical protein QHI48_07860 [Bacteroidota bacterium]|nr:hypothetical protein [Bacteroidota bacterium]
MSVVRLRLFMEREIKIERKGAYEPDTAVRVGPTWYSFRTYDPSALIRMERANVFLERSEWSTGTGCRTRMCSTGRQNV